MRTSASTAENPLRVAAAKSETNTEAERTQTERTQSERTQALRRRLEGVLGIPATEGNELTILRNGDEIFPAMLEAIKQAHTSIEFLTFVYWKGEIASEFAHALSERARNGVRVRVLLDAIGGRLIETQLLDHMSACGVEVAWFRKPWAGEQLRKPLRQNHRTHRKILVVDERVAFTGGVGIAQEWCGDAQNETQWRDTHVKVAGPAVDGIAAAFAQNWVETGSELVLEGHTFPEHQRSKQGSCVIVARGSASVSWSDIASVFRVLIESAEDHLRLMSAYFVPDECFQELFIQAARRGVKVEIMLPGPHADKRMCQAASESIYDRLIDEGVIIRAFQPSMLHAKVLTVDGIVSVVGSANMNRRSMSHDEEVVLAVLDPSVAQILQEQFDAEIARCETIVAGAWKERPLRQKALERATRIAHHFL